MEVNGGGGVNFLTGRGGWGAGSPSPGSDADRRDLADELTAATGTTTAGGGGNDVINATRATTAGG